MGGVSPTGGRGGAFVASKLVQGISAGLPERKGGVPSGDERGKVKPAQPAQADNFIATAPSE